jgi:hypothetical protein
MNLSAIFQAGFEGTGHAEQLHLFHFLQDCFVHDLSVLRLIGLKKTHPVRSLPD